MGARSLTCDPRSPRRRSELDCKLRLVLGVPASWLAGALDLSNEVGPPRLGAGGNQSPMNGTLTDLNQLLKSDRLFEIPIFQRGYAWEEENLRDLWEDLDYLGDRKHYFGTILLKETDKRTRGGLRTFDHFEVIDGQQRLTTTMILIRELISQFKELGDEDMSDQASKLEEDYIVYRGHYKLTIGGDDKFFFHHSILAGTSATTPRTRAQTRLRNAQAFFRHQLESRRRDLHGRDEYLDFLIELKSRIDRLEVMRYIVQSNAEAVRMFETVNDRGRPLTNLEKTKSILMYVAYLVADPTTLDMLLSELNDHFSAIYRCFEDIEKGLGLRDAGEIQRYHHIFFIGPHDSHKHMQVLKDLLMGKSRKDEDKEDCERFIRSYAGSLRQAFETMRDIATRRRDESPLGTAIDRLFRVGARGQPVSAPDRRLAEVREGFSAQGDPPSVRGLRISGLPRRQIQE